MALQDKGNYKGASEGWHSMQQDINNREHGTSVSGRDTVTGNNNNNGKGKDREEN